MERNKELKSIISKSIILAIVFLAIAMVSQNLFINSINKRIIERDFSIVGKLIEKYPEDKEDIIKSITKNIESKDIRKGEEILKKYGYKEELKPSSQPILRDSKRVMTRYILAFICLFLLSFIILIYFEYRKIYKKVDKLSRASEKVMEGDFSIYLDESGEGDFNILNHHFNQMSGRLKNNLDTLKEEKVYLKDTISNISHQLKTPLSSLIVLNDILLKDREMNEDLRVDFLNKTNSQLNRMEWLILNLLKLARIEAGSIEFKRESVYLKEIIDISLDTLKPLLKDTLIKIDGNLESKFIGDRDWTIEAMINIIKNAVEHGKGKIWITLEESPVFTSIIIKDNGKGIDNKDLPNIFKRFYKGKSKVKPDSIGIGLNLAKSIVEMQDGTISVSSKIEKGTEFTVRFLKRSLDKETLKV